MKNLMNYSRLNNIYKHKFNESLRYLIVLLVLLSSLTLNCYSLELKRARFNSTERTQHIPDFDSEYGVKPLVVSIVVSNLPVYMNEKFGFESIQLAITHPFISDIKVELQSPQGDIVWITNRNGKNGADYLETTFSQSGFKGHITNGKPPFLGNYIPDGDLANFNNRQNPNGVWKLIIYDLKKGDSGIFNSASLFFSNSPAKKVQAICNFNNPWKCRCSKGASDGKWLLPDLQIIADYTLNNITEVAPMSGKNGRLKFGVATVNLGLGPLEVVSENKWFCGTNEVEDSKECPDGTYARTKLTQLIYGLEKGKWVVRKKDAGTIAFDARPGHDHFHADDFVTYELISYTNSEGNQIKEQEKVVSSGTKASFCIWDLSHCREDISNCTINGRVYSAKNIANFGLGGKYTACNEALQGLSVGGIDYYGEDYEGQDIELPANTKNGNYFLRLIIDPYNNFSESNEENNVILIPIQLIKQNG